MKKVILLVIFLLILVAIPLTVFLARQRQENRQQAAPNTRLFIEPATLSKSVNDQFTLDIKADPGANQIGAATLKLTFPSQYLEVLGIQKGPDAAGVLASGVFDITAGTASISVNTSPTAPLQTIGILAQITFKASANTPANAPALVQFDFDPNNPENPDKTILSSPADADLGINIIQTVAPGSVTIGGPAATPGASASPTGSASPGASASTNPNATPGPSASPGSTVTTKISSPATGSSSSNNRPTFSGTSFPNAIVLIHINTSPAYIDQTQANASGAWSYTPTQDLAAGSYTLTVTGEDPNSTTTEDVAINFTVTSSGTGGTAVATPSPSASAASSTTTTSSEKGDVPVTGNTTPTMMIILLSVIFLGLGTGAALFYK